MENQKTALVIIDIQNDFCPPNGSLAVTDGDKTIPVINKLRDLGWSEIILTADYHPKEHVSFAVNNPGSKPFTTITLPNGKQQEMWPAHCVQNTEGYKFHKDLIVKDTDKVFHKGVKVDVDSYSGFGNVGEDTGLAAYLKEKNIKKVYCVGLAFDFCVQSTAHDALKNGFETYIGNKYFFYCLVMDATRGVSPDKCKTVEDNIRSTNQIKLIQSSEVKL